MREIRFRAWNTKTKKWLKFTSGFGVSFNGEIVCATSDKNLSPASKEFILMQFTGLKDKSGKEIYEHDILKGDVREWKKYPIFVVQWEQPLTRFTLVRPDGNDGFWGLEMTDKYSKGSIEHLEIIGNIYENPELLAPPITKKEKE